MGKYDHLFEPLVLGKTQFRNRIFAAPVGLEYYPSDNLFPGDDFIAYFERKAEGGAATVSIGSIMADNERGAVGPTIRLDDPHALAPHFRLTSCINRHGAVADAELQHCGPNAYHSHFTFGSPLYGAVDGVNPMGLEVQAMPEDIILETIEKYGDAAQTAKHCGYGMVTVAAGHGWMLNQFLSPKNTRKDQWGGSLENRVRFVNAIADNIKKKCGRGFPINLRISVTECDPNGYDEEYAKEFVKLLDGKWDMINASVGAHENPDVFTTTHPSMFLPDGVNVKYAAAIKSVLKETKVAAVGAIAEPEFMEEIIASGQADVVMLARELFADPDLPFKAQTGRDKEIRKCIRCFECFSCQFTKLSNICAINPEIGFERETKYADPIVKYKKNVLVAGGGPGGMMAALTASERGHKVTLVEKTGQLGGALRCETKVPFKQNLMKYLDHQARLVEDDPNIDLMLNTEANSELVEKINPDVVIAAIGAKQLVPRIPGIDGKNVMPVEYAYMHPDEIDDKAIILGGGLSGIECALFLKGMGKDAKIMEMANSLNFSGNLIHAMAINVELKKLNVELITSTKAVEINDKGVVGEYVGDNGSPAPLCDTIEKGMLQSVIHLAGGESDSEIGQQKLYEADTVIYALGMIPKREEALGLRGKTPLFFQIGDCLDPKNVYAANSTAYTIARDLGRY
ncbi:MAG: FAD-dependent oxidoreductase [Coriobacteriales bacterium]|jgi:2,4-dienoyl-CoA reductase-like NADH-dependent reductase (Old Yellow Enzyme family)/thioredoxin reductase